MAEDPVQTAVEKSPTQKALIHSLAVWGVVAPIYMVLRDAQLHQFAFDVHFAFVPAARAVLHGSSPYSSVTSLAVREGIAYLYPPLCAYLFVPFTWLPTVAAGVLATLLVAACVPAALLVLGIRDWRCYAMAFLWLPTLTGLQSANVTLPMVLGLALVWRYRERRAVIAVATGFLVALKVFFWPLLIWLVATRRYKTAAIGAVASAALVFAPWAGIGFAGLRAYPHLLSVVARHEGAQSYSVAALVHFVVPSWTAAVAVETFLGVALLVAVLVAGLRGRDRDAFALTIIAVLVLSPLLEIHYLALLLVVVALYRPRLSAAWIAPLFIWGASEANNGSGFNRVHVFVVVIAILVLAMSDWRPRALTRAVAAQDSLTAQT